MGLLFPASQSVPCFCFCLLTAIQGGVVESCNVDGKRSLRCTSLREWRAGFLFFRNTCDDMITGACSSGSLLLSTYKLSVERGACWRFSELSDRPTSLVCRVPVIALNQEEDSPVYTTKADKFRVHRFPWRQGSLFPSKHSAVAIAIRENTFLPAKVRRIYTPAAPLAGRGGALKLRGDAAFLIMSLYLPPSPSNLPEKQLSEKIWKWARRVLDRTPSRVPVLLLDANGHISQTPWPEQIGKYCSKKTTFNGQCLGELLRDHHLRAANTYFPVGATFFVPFSNTQIDSACRPATVCSQMLRTATRRR